ncbi:hypothetical protein INR49_017345 [Caranx melampygus]|nr:hypothetical protein INR49_017345 [Caranx melampygus]
MDTEVPEGLPQHLDTKHPGVDVGWIHKAQEQDGDDSGDEQESTVDAHSDSCQDTTSDSNKQEMVGT